MARATLSAGGAAHDLADLAARDAPPHPAGLVMARLRGGVVENASAGPVTGDAVFELGSITKVVTGLLLADAVTRGEVTLETPLADCLPGARPASHIALGDLAAHTAGLPRLPLAFIRRKGLLGDRTDPYADTTVEELVDDLASVRLRGPSMRYSNFGAALLGQALAAHSGTPYEQLVEDRVLRPLGVEEVWVRNAPAVAQPHDRRGRPVQAWTLGAYAPAGCLRGTARGALALSMVCLSPPPVMADAVAIALTPRGRRGQIESGLGWFRGPANSAKRVWWHNGGTNGSRAFTGFRPDNGHAVAAVTNSPRPTDRSGWQSLAR